MVSGTAFLAVVSVEDCHVDLTADGWTAAPELQRQLISCKQQDAVAAAERERADEILDFATMNGICARVDAVDLQAECTPGYYNSDGKSRSNADVAVGAPALPCGRP